jgi:hypothetical protein
VSATRNTDYKHAPADVNAGAALGLAFGAFGYLLNFHRWAGRGRGAGGTGQYRYGAQDVRPGRAVGDCVDRPHALSVHEWSRCMYDDMLMLMMLMRC